MRALTTRWMPAAARHGVDAQPAADGGDRTLRGRRVESQRAAGEARRVEVAEHDAGVGHGRPRRRRGRSRPGPGSAPALRGPTRSPPAASIHAMLPPPAPIVLTSTIGVRTG